MTLDGAAARRARCPSSEWRFHRDIYARASRRGRDRAHARAVRDHARLPRTAAFPRSTTWSPSPAADDIRCAPYATFGTQALSDHALAALDGRRACLLAHHGMIALGALARRARSRSPSRSRRSPRSTGARSRSASPRCSPTRRWTSCSRSSRPTASRGARTSTRSERRK